MKECRCDCGNPAECDCDCIPYDCNCDNPGYCSNECECNCQCFTINCYTATCSQCITCNFCTY